MKISLTLICEWLGRYEPELHGHGNGMHLSEVRLYQEGPVQYESVPSASEVLYLGTEDQFFHSGGKRIICKNEKEYIVLQSGNLPEVLNSVLEAFSYYARWEEECAKRISAGCSLSDILDIAEVLLRRPVQVVDGAQVIIGFSSGFMQFQNSPKWMEMIQRSGLPADVLSIFNQKYRNTFEQKETFYIPADIFPTAAWCRHIFFEDERFATMIVLVSEREFSKGELQLIEPVALQVRAWIEWNNQSDESASETSFLARLLDGMPNAGEELETRLESAGWKRNCQKQIYVASFISQYFYMEALLSRLLNEHSAGVYAIPYQKKLVILCNNDKLDHYSFREDLQQFLRQNNYYAAYSLPFLDLNHAEQAYRQTCQTLMLSEPVVGRLYSSTENAMQYITSIVQESSDLDLIHPAVNEIKQYDQQHHTDYYETLFTYLKNERNHQITSQELFIHRNTLFKRLKRIEELWPLDYENADLRFYLLYSFYQDHYDL